MVRGPILERNPEFGAITMPLLVGVASAIERESVARYAALAETMERRGEVEVADAFRRMLEEDRPDLVSLDSYAIAKQRDYAGADPARVLADFRAARAQTVARLRRADSRQLERRGTFAEYGEVSVRGLMHILCSHDQQHIACLHWLLARMSTARRS